MNNDKTPVSDFLNGLTRKVRETEQKINKPKAKKQNWDNARENTDPKSFSELDVKNSLKKAEKKLGELSAFASNKINDTVTRLNDRINDPDSENSDIPHTSYNKEGKNGAYEETEQIKEEVEVLMKDNSTTSKQKDNVFDIFSMTEGRTDRKDSTEANKTKKEEYVNNLQNLWNTKVLNDRNLEHVDRVVDSINDKFNHLYKKSNEWLNSPDDTQKSTNDKIGFDFYKIESKPFWVNANTVSSGTELLNIVEDNSGDNTTSFGVILDKGNEHNALMLALIAARNKDYSFLHLDLTNIQNNDLGKQRIKKNFKEISDFVKNDLHNGLLTVDVRGAEASAVESLLNMVHYVSSLPGSHNVEKWTVLVLADSFENIVDKNKTFSTEYSDTVVIEY